MASFLAFWWGIWIYQQKKKRQTWLWPSFPPWQVAERTLFLWNNDYIVRLITSSRKVAADRTTDRTAPKWWFEWKIRWGVSWNEAIPTSVISLHYVLDRFGIYIYVYIIDALYELCIWIILNLPGTSTCTNVCISSISLSSWTTTAKMLGKELLFCAWSLNISILHNHYWDVRGT